MSLRRRRLWLDDGTAGYDCIACSGVCVDGICRSAPPPPINTTYSDSDSTPITFRHKSRLVPNLLFAAAGLLVLSFLLLLATYAIHRFTRRRRRLLASAAPAYPTGAADDDDDGDVYEDGEADHHVWNIRTVGLDDATICSIAACVYNAKEGLLGGGQADCAVCLGELRDGEILRLLPKCGHAFHLPCVDTWLRAHVNCPLCRAPVLAPLADHLPPPPPPDVETSVPESTSSVVVDDTTSETNLEVPELKITIGIELVEFVSSSSSSPANSGLLNSLGENGLQPVRRSVSMDSSSLAALLLRGDSTQKPTEERVVIEIGEEQAVKNMGKQGGVVKGGALQKGPLQMKRSMSTRSGRFFLSRYARTRNSVIPL